MDNVRLVRSNQRLDYTNREEGQSGFFKYLRETGLYEESFNTDPSFAWVQINVVNYDRKKEIEEANKNRAGFIPMPPAPHRAVTPTLGHISVKTIIIMIHPH